MTTRRGCCCDCGCDISNMPPGDWPSCAPNLTSTWTHTDCSGVESSGTVTWTPHATNYLVWEPSVSVVGHMALSNLDLNFGSGYPFSGSFWTNNITACASGVCADSVPSGGPSLSDCCIPIGTHSVDGEYDLSGGVGPPNCQYAGTVMTWTGRADSDCDCDETEGSTWCLIYFYADGVYEDPDYIWTLDPDQYAITCASGVPSGFTIDTWKYTDIGGDEWVAERYEWVLIDSEKFSCSSTYESTGGNAACDGRTKCSDLDPTSYSPSTNPGTPP